jgi:2-polyprenyl-6-methoxyphenol hydroxylase-like FAD-dependent oxidoreductase
MWIDNKYKTEASISEYMEPGEFFSFFDTGDRTLAIIVAEHHNVVWDDPQDRITRLKETFKDEKAFVPQIFDFLKDEEINPSDLFDLNLKKWSKDGVVLMGDAAHGFGPWAGLGGSMALEDGYVLAGELMKVSPTYTLDEALKNFELKRRKRIKIARRLTNKMKAGAFIRSRIARKVLDVLLPYLPESYLINDFNKLLREEI